MDLITASSAYISAAGRSPRLIMSTDCIVSASGSPCDDSLNLSRSSAASSSMPMSSSMPTASFHSSVPAHSLSR